MTLPSQPPQPILPKSSKKLKLLDIDPIELSRQLTLMEATLYKTIRPMECIQRSRESKPGKLQDNITSIIQLSNRVSIRTLSSPLLPVLNSCGGVDCQLGSGFYS